MVKMRPGNDACERQLAGYSSLGLYIYGPLLLLFSKREINGGLFPRGYFNAVG